VTTFNTFYRTEGCYNLCDTQEVSAQYVFRLRADAPQGLGKGYTLPIAEDEHFNPADVSALDLALWLRDTLDRAYWYSSSKVKIRALIAYLEPLARQDAFDLLTARRNRLAKELRETEAELADIESVDTVASARG
jgi:hypothetical protein